MFLVAGPLIVAAGQLWLARIPASSEPWQAELGNPSTLIPPLDAIVDVLPANIAFGLGMAMVVAPLTSTLMNSIPARNSGLGSAINNALSRVGQPLIGAVIFIAITAAFYNILGSMVPGLDTTDPAVRAAIVPLNPVPPGTPDEVAAAAKGGVGQRVPPRGAGVGGPDGSRLRGVRHRPAVRLGDPGRGGRGGEPGGAGGRGGLRA